jgi:biopolymer transport protein ExbB
VRRIGIWLLVAAPLLIHLPASAAPEAGASGEEVQAVETEEIVSTSEQQRTFGEYFELGGNIMWLLVFLSAISVTLIFERAWALRRGAVMPKNFLVKLRDHWHRREISEVLTMCSTSDTSIARVLRAGLLHFGQDLARMEDAIETAGAHETTLLRRNLSLMSSLGNIATMLGLLGTVLGMIESFELIAETGTGDASVVAGGIFKALVTTAAGLGVGIFTIVFYSYFRRRVEILVIDLEEISFRLMEDLSQQRTPEPVPGGGNLAPAEA